MKVKFITPFVVAFSALPFVAISCGLTSAKMPSELPVGWEKKQIYQVEKFEDSTSNMSSLLEIKYSGFGSNVVLNESSYNTLYDKMSEYDIAIAIIADHKLYEQVLPVIKGDKVWDVLDRSGFDFKYYEALSLGKFLNTFKPKGETSWKHGTRTEQNYGDFYPLYYINHNFSQFGVSNWNVSPREVYEITYDDK